MQIEESPKSLGKKGVEFWRQNQRVLESAREKGN